MMRYASPADFRKALETRCKDESYAADRNLDWMRRRVAFVRLLTRLFNHGPAAWVLKGGMAVELRRPGLARSTQDIDVILRSGVVTSPSDPHEVRELLADAVVDDADGDGFRFVIGESKRLRDDAYGRPAWRFHIDADLAGRRFVSFRLDVVARPEEVGGTETLPLPDLLAFAGISPREVTVTDLRQQFAEKLHALTRTYVNGTSTRAKDLLDLVLLIEDGVPADVRLVERVRSVFRIRGSHAVPGRDIGRPPARLAEGYSGVAREIGSPITSAEEANDIVVAHWCRALDDMESASLHHTHPA